MRPMWAGLAVAGSWLTVAVVLIVISGTTLGVSHRPSGGVSTQLTIPLAPKPPLVVNVSPASVALDVNGTFTIIGSVSGGSGNASNWTYTWAGLPTNCTLPVGATLTCSPNATGSWSVTLTVHDSSTVQTTKSAAVPVVVNADVSIVEFTASGGTNVTAGYNFTLSVLTSGGTPPFTFSYTGLPAACSGTATASVTCTPTVSGTVTIAVTVHDSAGGSASQSIQMTVIGGSSPPPPPSLATIPAATYEEVAAILVVGAIIVATLFVKAHRDERAGIRRPPVQPASMGPTPPASTAPPASTEPPPPASPPSGG